VLPRKTTDVNSGAYLFTDDGIYGREVLSTRRRLTSDTITAIDAVLAGNESNLLNGWSDSDWYFNNLRRNH
jgi:hypothetical protein